MKVLYAEKIVHNFVEDISIADKATRLRFLTYHAIQLGQLGDAPFTKHAMLFLHVIPGNIALPLTRASENELSCAFRARQRPANRCDIEPCIRGGIPINGRHLCCTHQVLPDRVAPNALGKCHLFDLPGNAKWESTRVKEAWKRIMTSSTTDETPDDLDRTIASLAELMSKNKMDKLMKFFNHVDDDDEKTAACESVQQESAE